MSTGILGLDPIALCGSMEQIIDLSFWKLPFLDPFFAALCAERWSNCQTIRLLKNCNFLDSSSSQRSVWKNGKVREAGHVRTEEEKARF